MATLKTNEITHVVLPPTVLATLPTQSHDLPSHSCSCWRGTAGLIGFLLGFKDTVSQLWTDRNHHLGHAAQLQEGHQEDPPHRATYFQMHVFI